MTSPCLSSLLETHPFGSVGFSHSKLNYYTPDSRLKAQPRHPLPTSVPRGRLLRPLLGLRQRGSSRRLRPLHGLRLLLRVLATLALASPAVARRGSAGALGAVTRWARWARGVPKKKATVPGAERSSTALGKALAKAEVELGFGLGKAGSQTGSLWFENLFNSFLLCVFGRGGQTFSFGF